MFKFLFVCLVFFTHSAYAADDVIEILKMDAEQGSASAQLKLGFMYDFAQGVPEDDAEAVRWYRMAAEQGNAEAQLWLGRKYVIGKGIPRDNAEAVRWYRMAAEQGNAEAQFSLGRMYAKGEGVPEDDVQAYAWLSMAAAQGNDFAKEAKEVFADDMTNAQIAEAQKLSRKYWEAYGPAQ